MTNMKIVTFVFLMIISILISSKTYSQEVSGGIKGGLTMSNL